MFFFIESSKGVRQEKCLSPVQSFNWVSLARKVLFDWFIFINQLIGLNLFYLFSIDILQIWTYWVNQTLKCLSFFKEIIQIG